MHGQGNYTTQVGQAPYAPQFQHHPVVATPHPPPLLHHDPLPLHPQATHQGQPSFHFRPGVLAYQSTVPSVPHQGSAVPGVSSGMSSSQSYVTHPQPPLGNAHTRMPFPYPTSDQQRPSWGQNALHFPPAPCLAPSAYPLASSQEHTLERGPPHQPSFHAPPPPQPWNASSSSSFLRPDPYGHSVLPMRQNSYPQSVGTLPPPPPPPPLPCSSPVVPPLPSSPPSNACLKNDGSCSFNGELQNGNNFIFGLSPPGKPVEGRSLHLPEGLHPHTEKDDPKVELGDAIATHSPVDSDMDMEG